MNTPNLEAFVDSSSLFYSMEALGQAVFHKGLICELKLNSAFVDYRAGCGYYMLGNLIVFYPLYSRGAKGTEN